MRQALWNQPGPSRVFRSNQWQKFRGEPAEHQFAFRTRESAGRRFFGHLECKGLS